MISLMAGPMAQMKFCSRGIRKPHWQVDFDRAKQYALKNTRGDLRKAERVMYQCCWLSEKMLERQWGHVERLAYALLEHREMNREQVIDTLSSGESRGDWTEEFPSSSRGDPPATVQLCGVRLKSLRASIQSR